MTSRPSEAVLDWLRRLVALDTTSRRSNLPLIDLAAGHARSLGLEPLVAPDPGGAKANLVITVPAADGARSGGVMLSGHSDVVPVDGQVWTGEPFTLREEGGRVYGRGTADMKGFDAVVLAALGSLVAHPLAEPVHVALSHDEEVGCRGAAPLVDALAAAGLHPRLCFVGEPTSMRMIRGHKSINLVRIVVTGVAAHSSLPHQGVNAIDYAARIVAHWRDRCDRWRSEGPFDPDYPIAWTTGSVNTFAGGNAVNIIPDRAELTLEFRSVAGVDDHAELAALFSFCAGLEARMRAEQPGASIVCTAEAETVGLDTPADAPVVRFGRELGLAVQPDKVTYATEAGIYAQAGISTVVCGPGDIAQAHRPDEYIELSELAACEAFVARLARRLRA